MLVIPRLRGAIEGFVRRHGHWPTRLYVDPETHARHVEAAFSGAYEVDNRDLLVWISQRIQILPQDGAQYLAADDSGGRYDYGTEGFEGDYLSAKGVLKAWQSLSELQ
jgi:hypothetical protein